MQGNKPTMLTEVLQNTQHICSRCQAATLCTLCVENINTRICFIQGQIYSSSQKLMIHAKAISTTSTDVPAHLFLPFKCLRLYQSELIQSLLQITHRGFSSSLPPCCVTSTIQVSDHSISKQFSDFYLNISNSFKQAQTVKNKKKGYKSPRDS